MITNVLKVLTFAALIMLGVCVLTPNALCIKSTDLNTDGVISIDDVVLAAEFFGSNPVHSRWDPIADLDGDNNVAIEDLMAILSDCGKAWIQQNLCILFSLLA
ncbi:MAG: hypothetical protein JSV05_05775 [Candidatus Bathyarchaeota archaeon]|nr:MAG: hypothetical protein JSV05_05775 [Candidatus Bathyarchaeota archaeon]